jgi:cell wall-associated NlpC family hydrolase
MKYLIVLLIAFFSFNFGSATSSPTKPASQVKIIDVRDKLINHSKKQHLVDATKSLVRFVDKTSYVYSGSTPSGWDCSGLVVWTYENIGITLPHSADKQAHQGRRVSKPKIGDIVVFAYPGSTKFYHSAIYFGDSKIINANKMFGTTKIQLLTDFEDSQIRFVRII